MICGVGTDLAEIARFEAMIARRGLAVGRRLLAASERADFAASLDPARFLAKRFAAKEALAKALGTGVRAPVLLTAIAVGHDALGKPQFELSAELSAFVATRGVTHLHLSISDERTQALAFVVAECRMV
jgi:holo-[acyl-carrier protein] synthase